MTYADRVTTGVERTFPENQIIVSKTDMSGKLIYGNRTFFDISGMDERECLGKQHNIVRHPGMPRSVFDLLWETLKKGEEIFAYIINRAKNGDHYWVFAHVTPSKDRRGQIVGYHSSRRTPDKRIIEQKIKPLYAQLMDIEKSASSPRKGLADARAKIDEMIKPHQSDFNCFIFSLSKERL